MVLDIQLNSDKKKLLKTKFNSFLQEINLLLINSNLFVENPKLVGHFMSVRVYKKNNSNSNGNKPFIKIDAQKYISTSDLNVDYYGWSSLAITWTEIVSEKKTGGFLFVKERIDFEYRNLTFFPCYLDDDNNNIQERIREYKTRQNYLWFKDLIKKNTEKVCITEDEMNVLNQIFSKIYSLINEVRVQNISNEKLFQLNKSNLIKELDKDNNGQIDLIGEKDFLKLLNKHQRKIIDIDRNYIQKCVKLSGYFKTKKQNIQNIFLSINQLSDEQELNELLGFLKNQIHSYELLIFHSISMITSLVNDDLIVFYEIYECFDQLGVFNSNWENEVSNKLTNIGEGLKELLYSINEMENNIVNSIEHLAYVTQDSFNDLQSSITNELREIDSSIQVNNLLTGIQTYQMYRINQNTRRII